MKARLAHAARVLVEPACWRNVGFVADDRIDADIFGLAVELEGTVEIAVVGECQGIHAEVFGARDECADLSSDTANCGACGKTCEYLHLPVQSGSDRILMAMKRGHSAFDYKQKLRRLREIRPNISLSSDFIVGFPGETDADFEALMNLIAEMGFDQSFSFIYSARPGTPAEWKCPIRSMFFSIVAITLPSMICIW